MTPLVFGVLQLLEYFANFPVFISHAISNFQKCQSLAMATLLLGQYLKILKLPGFWTSCKKINIQKVPKGGSVIVLREGYSMIWKVIKHNQNA